MLTISRPLPLAVPQPVFLAVRLMYTGAALGVLLPTVGLLVASGHPQVFMAVFAGACDCVLWLWMARKNESGRAWARILSTIFFAGFCVGMVLDVRHGPIEVSVLAVISWLVALGAVILIWRPESGRFYRERSALVEVI
jgi:hypothetical protein